MYTQLGVMTKGTVIEVNVSELGMVTTGGKVVFGKYAQITNNPENDGCINAILCMCSFPSFQPSILRTFQWFNVDSVQTYFSCVLLFTIVPIALNVKLYASSFPWYCTKKYDELKRC